MNWREEKRIERKALKIALAALIVIVLVIASAYYAPELIGH